MYILKPSLLELLEFISPKQLPHHRGGPGPEDPGPIGSSGHLVPRLVTEKSRPGSGQTGPRVP